MSATNLSARLVRHIETARLRKMKSLERELADLAAATPIGVTQHIGVVFNRDYCADDADLLETMIGVFKRFAKIPWANFGRIALSSGGPHAMIMTADGAGWSHRENIVVPMAEFVRAWEWSEKSVSASRAEREGLRACAGVK